MKIRALWTSLLVALLGTLLVAQAHGQIFVSSPSNGTVGEYNLDGTTVNASLITGLTGPAGLALSGNKLYAVTDVGSGTVGEYDATSGAAINATLVTGLSSPQALVLSGNNLYVTNSIANGFVGLYDATTGAAINTSLVTGQYYSEGIAISGNNL